MNYYRNIENDVLTVGIQASDGRYILWQKGLTTEVGSGDGIYFEYDDQVNGAYDNINECTINKAGIHLVLQNQRKFCFQFDEGFEEFLKLKDGLDEIYRGIETIRNISIQIDD